MIKTLIFDIGKVLIPFDFARGYSIIEERTGLTHEEIRERIRSTGVVDPFERGELEPEAFVHALTKGLGFSADLAGFKSIWGSIFLPDPILPEEFLAQLKQRYRLLTLSNTNAIHFEALAATYPLFDLFDHHVLSFRVGAMKPDAKIYQYAIEHAEAKPEECFFTDDLPDNIAGAREHGLDAVLFEGREGLEEALRQRGVEW